MSSTATTTTMPDAYALRERIKHLRAELAADPERKIMRLRGVPVGPGPHRTRDVVQAELDAALAELPAAEQREREGDAERARRQQAEEDRRERTALERATAAAAAGAQAQQDLEAAHAAWDALVAGSPLARLLDARERRLEAATALHAALGVLGSVSLHGDGLNDAQRALLGRLGPQAAAARRALPDGHPARLPHVPEVRRYGWLLERLLTPPTAYTDGRKP